MIDNNPRNEDPISGEAGAHPVGTGVGAAGGAVAGATCLLYTSPSPRDGLLSRMPSSA